MIRRRRRRRRTIPGNETIFKLAKKEKNATDFVKKNMKTMSAFFILHIHTWLEQKSAQNRFIHFNWR